MLVAERDDRPVEGADYPETYIGVELNSTLPVRTDGACFGVDFGKSYPLGEDSPRVNA